MLNIEAYAFLVFSFWLIRWPYLQRPPVLSCVPLLLVDANFCSGYLDDIRQLGAGDSNVIAGYILINVLLVAMIFLARSALLNFLGTHQAIDSEAALNAFKHVARWNMRGALVYIVSGVVLMGLAVLLVKQHGLIGVVVVLMFSIPSIFLGVNTKKLEDRSKTLTCNEAFKAEYARVIDVWARKALPDF